MNLKSNLGWIAALMLAVILIGCGGGGGGSSSSGGPGGGTGNAPYPGQYIEFVATSTGAFIDPLNLKVGDDFQVVAANYDLGGTRTVLATSNLVCTANPGDVLVSGKRLQILSRPAGIFTVSCDVNVSGSLKHLDQDCAAPTGTTTVSGRVVQDGTGIGAKYIEVTFYDASGALLSAARTGNNGQFVATVPNNTKSVSIKASTVPAPPYYRSFIFKSKVYTMDASTCPVHLTVIPGQNNALTSTLALYLQENGPPPPPDGCTP